MEIKVPKNVVDALKKMRAAREADQELERKAREKEQLRLSKINKLRSERSVELFKCAQEIFSWKQQFENTNEWKELLDLFGDSDVPLFIGRFWRGEPLPDSVITEWATCGLIRINGPLIQGFLNPIIAFYYAEYHKSHEACREIITTPYDLEQRLHPDFIEQLHAHLTGPHPFKYILQAITQRTGLR